MRRSSRRVSRSRSAARAVAGALLLAGVPGCSVLLDWSGYSDAGAPSSEAGAPQDAGSGAGRAGSTCGLNRICTAVPPDGWNGPYAVFDTPTRQSDGELPPCGAGFGNIPAYEGNEGPLTSDFLCPNCACEPTNVTCQPPQLTAYSDPECMHPCGESRTLDSLACVTLPAGCSNYTITGLRTVGAPCGAVVRGDPEPVKASFASRVRACTPAVQATREGCRDQEVCLPQPAAPYRLQFCIEKAGVNDAGPNECPANYPNPLVTYAGVHDTRTCTECTCGPPTGTSCTGQTAKVNKVVPFATCPLTLPAGPQPSLPRPCTQADDGSQFFFEGSKPNAGVGYCTASGGEPIGGIEYLSPALFCCTN